MREIIFDTETTGFDPLSGDRMVEIGCIEMVGRVMTGATFHCYYNPERDMPAGAEAVHGLSTKFLSDKPLFASKAQELAQSDEHQRLNVKYQGLDVRLTGVAGKVVKGIMA